jgi:nitrogen PTS system EIIA component
MKISDFLSPTNVIVDVRASNKHLLLQEMVSRAAVDLAAPAEEILAALLKREQLGSTGVGRGVAIPHARLPKLTQPLGVLARMKPPIDFDAIDGEAVDVVFLLLLPAAPETDALVALALVARKLKEPEALNRLRRARTAAEFYSATTE